VDGQRRVGPDADGELVGRVQDPLAAAPVHGECVGDGRGAVGLREVAGEVEDVARGSAPPAVDRLARVAHRRDRMPPAVAGIRPGEQPAQQRRLCGRGVLVLVEEDDGELAAQRLGHAGHLGGQPGGIGHLVGELDVAQFGLELLVPDDQRGQFQPLVLRDPCFGDGFVLGAPAAGRCGQGCGEDLRLAGELDGPHQVGPQLPGQVDHPLGDVLGTQPRQVVQRSGRVRDRSRGQPVAGGSGDHPSARLDAEQQRVLGHQASGERVVGEDQFLGALGVEQAGGAEGPPHPAAEFAGRLAGEGQAEHLVGADGARPHQPDDPGRHHGGLARARAGDDHGRFQRRGDRRQLLVGEGDPQQVGELAGIGETHPTTCRPRSLAGQLPAKGHRAHWAPGVAGKRPSATIRAAATSLWCAQVS